MATLEKKQGYAGGREGALSSWGTAIRWTGYGCCALAVFAAVNASGDAPGLYLAMGIIGLLQGIISDVFFQGFAEMIRILKKQNGLPYGGEILSPTPTFLLVCSECGSANGPSSVPRRCANCGAVLRGQPAE